MRIENPKTAASWPHRCNVIGGGDSTRLAIRVPRFFFLRKVERMNRLLQFLSRPCACCEARRLNDRLNAACERVELDSGSAIEFVVPSVHTLAGDRDESDFDDPRDAARGPRVKFFCVPEPVSVPIDTDLRQYAIDELRRISAELATAADLIESAGPIAQAPEGGVN